MHAIVKTSACINEYQFITFEITFEASTNVSYNVGLQTQISDKRYIKMRS